MSMINSSTSRVLLIKIGQAGIRNFATSMKSVLVNDTPLEMNEELLRGMDVFAKQRAVMGTGEASPGELREALRMFGGDYPLDLDDVTSGAYEQSLADAEVTMSAQRAQAVERCKGVDAQHSMAVQIARDFALSPREFDSTNEPL